MVEGAFYRAEPSLAQLLTSLVSDAKTLLCHELALATYEIREDLRKTKRAMLSLGMGIGAAALGRLLLILMLVHLLYGLAGLPLWACYGIVGGLLAIRERYCCSSARRRLPTLT